MIAAKFIAVLFLIAVNAICSGACGGGSKSSTSTAQPPCNCQCPKPAPCPAINVNGPARNWKPVPNPPSIPYPNPGNFPPPPQYPGYNGNYPGHQYPNQANYPNYPSNVPVSPAFTAFHKIEKSTNIQKSNNNPVKTHEIGLGFGIVDYQHSRTEEGWTKHTSIKESW